jgi:excinuclease UvrABC nuclease subunit
MFDALFDDCLQINLAQQASDVLKPLPTCKGVLLFTDDNNRPIQLLIAANIRRMASCRLFPQKAITVSKCTNISGIARKIYYFSCYNDFKSALKHYQIVQVVYPHSWREAVTFPKQSYVRIETTAKWPFFSLTDKASVSNKEKLFGPFPTRKAAGDFIQILQNAFALCQRPTLIETGQKAVSCPYLQMDSCGAPCVGKVSRPEYLRQVTNAISAASGNIEAQMEKLQNHMRRLARQRAFEQAQAVKKQLTQLELLNKREYRWTMELSGLAILHIDRSVKIAVEGRRRKIQTYAGYLITAGQVAELGEFTIDEPGEFYKSFIEKLAEPANLKDSKQLTERLSLLAYHLYRSRPAGIWIDCSDKQHTLGIEEIRNAVCKRFDVRPEC